MEFGNMVLEEAERVNATRLVPGFDYPIGRYRLSYGKVIYAPDLGWDPMVYISKQLIRQWMARRRQMLKEDLKT